MSRGPGSMQQWIDDELAAYSGGRTVAEMHREFLKEESRRFGGEPGSAGDHPRAVRHSMTRALRKLEKLGKVRREGDVWQSPIRDGVLTVRQQKTGTPLSLPVRAELAEIVAATPSGNLTLLTTKTGKPYGGNDFSDQFRDWCDAAGLPSNCSIHGLRKAAARRLAEAGCSAHEIASITGHKTLKEVERYTLSAEQARLARQAMARQENKA